MLKIQPYRNELDAMKSLDNGGRFYNLLTKADDGVISAAEIGKLAGVFTGRQQMAMYLEMATIDLAEADTQNLLSKIEMPLKDSLEPHRPVHCHPAEARQKNAADPIIVSGTPQHIDAKETFSGFVMVPIVTGDTTIFTMIPIVDQYDVYRIWDSSRSTEFLLAHARGAAKLDEVETRFGGVLKKLHDKSEESEDHELFLEAQYYTVLAVTRG